MPVKVIMNEYIETFFDSEHLNAIHEGATLARPDGEYRWKINGFIPEITQRQGLNHRRLTIHGLDADTGCPMVLTREWSDMTAAAGRRMLRDLACQLSAAGIREALPDLLSEAHDLPVVTLVLGCRYDTAGVLQRTWKIEPCRDQRAVADSVA
jgi:hypothetical protein